MHRANESDWRANAVVRGAQRALRRCVVGIAVLGVVAGLAAPAAQAALPDGRAYQLVNLPDTNGGAIGLPAVSPSGDRVEYLVQQGPGPGAASLLLASRTPTGWSVGSMLPPADQLVFNGEYAVGGWTPDLGSVFIGAHPGLLTGNFPVTLLRLDAGGVQSELASWGVGDVGLLLLTYGGVASDDGSHFYAQSQKAFDSGQTPGTTLVYDFGSGSPVAVSRLPDDSLPACGISAFIALGSTMGQHWASIDGARVFFLSSGSASCSAPGQLYVRDRSANGGAGATTEISGPAIAGADRPATFVRASADGTQAVFTTAARLTPDDTNTDRDVYRFTLGSGNECLTCGVADAAVDGQVAVSDDLSHVYFSSSNALAPGATPGHANLYVWHPDPGSSGSDRIDYVSPGIPGGLVNDATGTSELTPDGNVLVFGSSDPGMDAVTAGGASNGGFFEYYRYDDQSKVVECVSCPADHPASVSAGTALVRRASGPVVNARAMSDDGRMIFFQTSEPLVAQDVNGSFDIYEWHDGRVGLISNGVTPHPPVTSDGIADVSPNGDDVFFFSYVPLVPQATQGNAQLYDARVGATPAAPIRQPTPCAGEGCQGALAAAPGLPAARSETFDGLGNERPASPATLSVVAVSARARALAARTGRLPLTVRVTVGGRVTATATARIGGHAVAIARAAKGVAHAGRVQLTLKLSHAARRQLARRGSLRVSVLVRSSEVASAREVSFMLHAARAGGR